MDYKLSIFLDVRRKLDNGRYPIRIRAWHYGLKKAKLFKTELAMFEEDYNNSWGSGKSKQKLKRVNLKNYNILEKLFNWAENQAQLMEYFDFEEYGKRLNRRDADQTSLTYHFKRTIQDFEGQDRFGAASSYKYAMLSLIKFSNSQKGGSAEDLSFMEITPKWLRDYEKWMIGVNGSSITTVSIYTRTLRVIFNTAIKERNDLDLKFYPFGRGKYMIPSAKKVKKTLTQKQVSIFFKSELPLLQEQARDYWFFSYLCKGMNFKDIATLKHKNFKDNKLSYIREKTKLKKREQIAEIVVSLNTLAIDILEKYKTEYKGENSYLFPILNESDKPKDVFRKVNNFVRATNQQLKNTAKLLEFPEGLSTYWARHGYATNMINAGASLERIQADLQHADISTTQRYFDGFEKDIKDEYMEKLIENLNNGN